MVRKNETKKDENKEDVKIGQGGQESGQESGVQGLSEKARLEHLYSEMKTFGINSIGDVEVKLSRL